jgi:hypothetical protein
MSNLSSSLVVPDSLLAKEATDLLREHSTDLLFNHSIRVYFFAAEQGRQRKLRFDPELLYVAAAFHDFGLLKKFSSPDERFEVDGANAARQFLTAHKVPEERVEIAWTAIALHTTPGVTQHMRPEVALLYSGVGLDVLGRGFDQFPSEVREEVVARYPRKHFKKAFIQEYFAGFAHKREPSSRSAIEAFGRPCSNQMRCNVELELSGFILNPATVFILWCKESSAFSNC